MKSFFKKFFKKLFTLRYNPKRLRKYLEKGTWITNPTNNNLDIYIQAAHLLGVKKDLGSWSDLGKSLGMISSWGSRPEIQDTIFTKIGQDLKVPPLPKKNWERAPKPSIKGIAQKLGLQCLADVNKISYDFIVFAYVDYKKRQ